MSTLQVNSQIELNIDDVLNGIAQLDNEELEQFTSKVVAIHAKRRIPSLSKTESELLMKINHGVEQEVRGRYEFLNQKLHDDDISEDEHQELLNIINQIESADAERIHAMIELSQLRNVSIDRLTEQLGIATPVYG